MKNLILFVSLTVTFMSCQSSKNINVINAGIGGDTTSDLLKRIDSTVIDKKPDLVIIMVGTNDMLNSRKMKPYFEYKQNLEKIVKKLKNEKILVALCSPPTVDSIYLFNRHKRESYSQEPNIKLDSISQFMKRLSIKEDLIFIDINSKFKELNLPIHNVDEYIRNKKNSNVGDGVHPTGKGYNLIAETILHYLKQHNLIKRKMKIICFGDSITFGTGVEGQGTTEGNTYPAILKSRLSKMFLL